MDRRRALGADEAIPRPHADRHAARGTWTDTGTWRNPPRHVADGVVRTYIAARLIQLVFVLIGVSLIVFITMHLLPGDVAQLLLGDRATNEQLQRLREQLGLDQ